jgi:hypothetical protein
MAASTTIIVDMTTVLTNGPSSTTTANALAAGGPIMDYLGNSKLLLLKFNETSQLLAKIITDTDATDATNLALLVGVQSTLKGTSSPSVAMITDLGTVLTNGQNAATVAKTNNPAGPILDYVGNIHLTRGKLKDALVLATRVVSVTDVGTDAANKTLMTNILLDLV